MALEKSVNGAVSGSSPSSVSLLLLLLLQVMIKQIISFVYDT